jgi:hypothetical protein
MKEPLFDVVALHEDPVASRFLPPGVKAWRSARTMAEDIHRAKTLGLGPKSTMPEPVLTEEQRKDPIFEAKARVALAKAHGLM